MCSCSCVQSTENRKMISPALCKMESHSLLVSLSLPPLLAACLDFGDSPQILTGSVTIPQSCSLEPTVSPCSPHDDFAEVVVVNIDITDHVERGFWGLRFSGPILARQLSPRDAISVVAVTPHGSCTWLRYHSAFLSSPLLTTSAVTCRLPPTMFARTSLRTSTTVSASSATASAFSEAPRCCSVVNLQMDCLTVHQLRIGESSHPLLRAARGQREVVS
jgi:hypothetical protein